MKAVELSPVILLCAGRSSRMGQPKGLVPHQGKPWLEHQLESLQRVGVNKVVIVLGYCADEYLVQLPWLADARLHHGTSVFGINVRAIINPSPQEGPFSSIQFGGANAQEHAHAFSDYFWVLPIDVPCPPRKVWETLSGSTAAACIPTSDGRGGHPVRLSDSFLRHLRRIPAGTAEFRLDRQLRLLGSEAERLEVDDPDILKNLNTPEEFRAFKEREGRR